MRLRVMTYNIHRAIGLDRRFRLDRVGDIIAHHDPDIVLLQEVDDGAPRSGRLDLADELASRQGYPYKAVGLNVALRKGRYGNATLSRFPILRERNIDLTIDTRKRRGCQHTTIEVQRPGTKIHHLEVFNLHLGLSAQERARQTGELVRSKEFRDLDERQACIVGGDFNDWRLLLHPIFMEILRFQSVTHAADEYATKLPTFPSFSPRGGLDRLYHRGPLRLVEACTCPLVSAKVASDHLPVVAEFDLHG